MWCWLMIVLLRVRILRKKKSNGMGPKIFIAEQSMWANNIIMRAIDELKNCCWFVAQGVVDAT
jgi:hypothetical protein